MSTSTITFPVEPGHMGIDWSIGAFLHPSRKIVTETRVINNVSYTVPAFSGRREVIIQLLSAGDVWFCFGAPAVVGQGFRISGDGAIFGLPVSPNIAVALISAAPVSTFIWQGGM